MLEFDVVDVCCLTDCRRRWSLRRTWRLTSLWSGSIWVNW